ncbi:hypothetical protein JCM10908_004515 [Rhodotorula pacifica]|uniref:DUF1479 domain-containing protein n=1 Tax=Rhodotorula pacifica TaxID=1495444 RepID=UPI00317FB546
MLSRNLARSAAPAQANLRRCLATGTTARRALASAESEKPEGSIASVFSSLGGDAFVPLEARFLDLKKQLFSDGLIESWRSVLAALEDRTAEIRQVGTSLIPQVTYSDVQAGLSKEMTEEVKRVGTVVVHGAVPEAEADGWKQQIKDYISANRSLARGFPEDDPQVWELYNSVAQTRARTHPGLLGTQKWLLSLFHTSDASSPVSISTPISYYDRLRMRHPGDAVFALGPHIDGGSLERWEDAGFRSCFKGIFAGGPDPQVRHDPWDLSPRLNANTDLYGGSGQCSVFRMFQGWTALSRTSPGEGTLQVFPDVNLASAYVMLRPFFKPRQGREDRLGFDDWEVDLESTIFPGSVKGKGQELSDQTHPHLRLNETMISVPSVVPGSQVYWHCDVIHAVESKHGGASDSSVLYIPAAPLTLSNAEYLKRQRERFEAGRPAPDFPGGEGESRFVGRASRADVHEGDKSQGLRALGYERFVPAQEETAGGKKVIEAANKVLGLN